MTQAAYRKSRPDHVLLSVIVSAYNVAPYISQCIASILASDSRAIELIVVDDGSTDTTPDVIRAFAHDERLMHIEQDNGGPGKARNTGIAQARGCYLLFVDGDDWIEPELVKVCLAAIGRNPDADLLIFDHLEVAGSTRTARRSTGTFWGSQNAPWNKVFRRSLIGDSRFDEDIFYEDLAIVRYWVALARSIVKIDQALYNYRVARAGSIMTSADSARFFDLPVAAMRCAQRIEAAAVSDLLDPRAELGTDWKMRFYTREVFIVGVIQWSARIAEPAARRQFVIDFMARMPDDETPDIAMVAREVGIRVAIASLAYKYGASRSADILLHGPGRLKRKSRRLLGR